ncbi:MAG TPA: pitrilysin family protein [Patescibacteria group bacterium]|nr:pitrilysin family protein [Patescibacteria group bacterium]
MVAQVYHLSNGTPVAIDVQPNTDVAAVGMFFDIGARFENKKNNGAAHFLEHMFFKGTGRRTAEQLSAEIEDDGLDIDAATGHESTYYALNGLAADVPHMIDILGDMITGSDLPPAELKRERGAILQEIAQDEDDLQDLINTMARAVSYPGQPFGAEILGPRKNVREMSRQTLIDFKKQHYHAGNLIVSVAGNVDPDAVLAQLEQAIGRLPAKPKSTCAPAVYQPGHDHLDLPSGQFHLQMTFNSCAQSSPDYWPARLLATIMGGGMSSRLFSEVRNKRGLVYDIHAMNSVSSDTGNLEIYAATDPKDVKTLVPVLCDEIKKLRNDGVTERELARAKKQILVGMAEMAESTESRMHMMASHLSVFGRILSRDEIHRAVEGVSLQAVNDVARKILSSQPSLATIGPVRKAASYENVLKLLELPAP